MHRSFIFPRRRGTRGSNALILMPDVADDIGSVDAVHSRDFSLHHCPHGQSVTRAQVFLDDIEKATGREKLDIDLCLGQPPAKLSLIDHGNQGLVRLQPAFIGFNRVLNGAVPRLDVWGFRCGGSPAARQSSIAWRYSRPVTVSRRWKRLWLRSSQTPVSACPQRAVVGDDENRAGGSLQ